MNDSVYVYLPTFVNFKEWCTHNSHTCINIQIKNILHRTEQAVNKMPPDFSLFFPLFIVLTLPGVFSLCPWELPGLQPWSAQDTWDGSPPQDGYTVLVTKPILLDTQTPRIRLLDIRDGGMIVFSPEDEVKLTVGIVRLIHNGSMLVGSPECRYPGQAEIILIGEN